MNYPRVLNHNPNIEKPNEKNNQSSLEMYEMYSPDKNKPRIPYINNPVVGLVEAVSDSINYAGPKNLTLGNFYYNQGRFRRAIENYVLNILPEKYTLKIDKRYSFIGLARCYLKLNDFSSAINYFHRAIILFDQNEIVNISDHFLFKEICKRLREYFEEKLINISDSLDLSEFISELLQDKSGWDLAVTVIEFIMGKDDN